MLVLASDMAAGYGRKRPLPQHQHQHPCSGRRIPVAPAQASESTPACHDFFSLLSALVKLRWPCPPGASFIPFIQGLRPGITVPVPPSLCLPADLCVVETTWEEEDAAAPLHVVPRLPCLSVLQASS